MSGKPILDFDVVREPWNIYELADGTTIKLKFVVTRVRKRVVEQKANYDFDLQNITVALVPDELKGPVDTRIYSPQELEASIVKDDIRYTTRSEEWNEYVIDDGARLRIKATVTRVAKTSKFDKNGEPVYLVESSFLTQVRTPLTT